MQNWITPFIIFRFGLVQACLGMIVALTNSTMNRVMVVELGWAAAIPGLLVGLHYVLQLSRPKMGHSSDVGVARTPWIIGGMTLLALSALLASAALMIAPYSNGWSLAIITIAFAGIGLGVSAAGTSLLALVAKMAGDKSRAPAATTLWIMMIAGIAISSIIIGQQLDPFSLEALARITAIVGGLAVLLTSAALWGVERRAPVEVRAEIREDSTKSSQSSEDFVAALKQVMADTKARQFTIFVFVSMLAYSCQDLILEPFGGLVFGMTPGETTQLSGYHHAAAFVGMILVGVLGGLPAIRRYISLKSWMITGCVLSGVALLLIPVGGLSPEAWSLNANIAALGFGNGMFTIGAVGMMMRLAGEGAEGQEGVRMGVWGAAQALGFGIGGSMGSFGVTALDTTFTLSPIISYGSIFVLEAMMFLWAARLALRLENPAGLNSSKDASQAIGAGSGGSGSVLAGSGVSGAVTHSSRVEPSFHSPFTERPSA